MFNYTPVFVDAAGYPFPLISIDDLLHMYMCTCVLARSPYPITPVRTFYVVKINNKIYKKTPRERTNGGVMMRILFGDRRPPAG